MSGHAQAPALRLATSTIGWLPINPIGVRSVCGLKRSRRPVRWLMPTSLGEPSSSVWPSASARATLTAPMVPLAPAMFSTCTGWPSRRDSEGATARATKSTLPPAG